MPDKSTEQLQAEIEALNKQKIEACQKEISTVLEKHGCFLNPIAVLTSQGMQMSVQVAKK